MGETPFARWKLVGSAALVIGVRTDIDDLTVHSVKYARLVSTLTSNKAFFQALPCQY